MLFLFSRKMVNKLGQHFCFISFNVSAIASVEIFEIQSELKVTNVGLAKNVGDAEIFG